MRCAIFPSYGYSVKAGADGFPDTKNQVPEPSHSQEAQSAQREEQEQQLCRDTHFPVRWELAGGQREATAIQLGDPQAGVSDAAASHIT